MLYSAKLRILLFFVTLTCVLAPSFSSAKSNACLSIYEGKFKSGRQTWLSEPRAIGDSVEARYLPSGKVVELKEAVITNQCRTSECYLFSMINYINVKNVNSGVAPGLDISISEPYLVAHKFLQHIREGVWYGLSSPKVIHDLKGGFTYEGLHLTRKVGLVPKAAWMPAEEYSSWDMKKVYETLEAKVPEWNRYITSLAQQHGSYDAPAVRAAEKEAYDQLKNIILQFTGPLPQQFTWQGSNYTPESFEKIAGIQAGRILAIDNKEGYGVPEGTKEILNEAMVNHGGTWRYQQGDYNTIITSTVRFIEAGHPVIIDFGWQDGGHSMLVVGYEANSQNQVTRFKIMNSWGQSFGNDGYAWYTIDDVWNKVHRVYKFGVAQ